MTRLVRLPLGCTRAEAATRGAAFAHNEGMLLNMHIVLQAVYAGNNCTERGCLRRAIYNWEGMPPMYCSDHKEPDMVPLAPSCHMAGDYFWDIFAFRYVALCFSFSALKDAI